MRITDQLNNWSVKVVVTCVIIGDENRNDASVVYGRNTKIDKVGRSVEHRWYGPRPEYKSCSGQLVLERTLAEKRISFHQRPCRTREQSGQERRHNSVWRHLRYVLTTDRFPFLSRSGFDCALSAWEKRSIRIVFVERHSRDIQRRQVIETA